jgi:hypothetical protein
LLALTLIKAPLSGNNINKLLNLAGKIQHQNEKESQFKTTRVKRIFGFDIPVPDFDGFLFRLPDFVLCI